MVESEGESHGKGWLDTATFETVVASTPLVSIDLLVQNEKGEYLFGFRNNRPAQGYWFVPGGRIQKNETLDAAFGRLTRDELGISYERNQACFSGVYEHIYGDSIFGERISTHYVVLAYSIVLATGAARLDEKQHSNLLWIKPENLNQYPIHRYSLAYFENSVWARLDDNS